MNWVATDYQRFGDKMRFIAMPVYRGLRCRLFLAETGPRFQEAAKVPRMTDALPLRIFLATPGDLSDERKVIVACIEERNRRADGSHVSFEVVGWERVRGTARRPQEAINELIEECHFMIVMFKRSWGSHPGSPWGYTSGTEEELFTGLLELGLREQPMREVWVAFVHDDKPDSRIIDLKKQMTIGNALMYESIKDAVDLKKKLTDRLGGWEAAVSAAMKNCP